MTRISIASRPHRRSRARESLPPEYLRLVRQFPLRELRSDADLDEALAVMTPLLGRTRTPGQSQYLRALSILIEDYESRRHPLDRRDVTPLAALKHLMESTGMSQADLAKLLKVTPSMASMVLSGAREISKTNAKALAAHFHLNVGLFV